ncbi:MAG: tetratricopeptide repeat protein, partial [Vicinamibacterales bacterium]
AMPGMSGMASGSGPWTYVVGVSAARTGDLATAEAAASALAQLTAQAQGGPASYAARPHLVRQQELAAEILWAKGQKDAAIAAAREAADTEKTLNAPSGPPDPIKPAFELYGEMLLEAGQPREAMAAFDQALQRTPRRTPSVLGLARAAAAAGDRATARAQYQVLVSMPGANTSAAAFAEAQKALKSSN